MSPALPPPPKSEPPSPEPARPISPELAERIRVIDQILPQTQCQRCGFPACLPYAEAIARGEAEINRCPPGGQTGVTRLAQLTGRPAKPLDPACGQEGPLQLAQIREADCIGCVLCLEACPVDAIAGAFKRMHTVIAADCTGCALCVPVCPVDCIEMVSPVPAIQWSEAAAEGARQRFLRRLSRRGRPGGPSRRGPIETQGSETQGSETQGSETKKRAILAAALARAARRGRS